MIKLGSIERLSSVDMKEQYIDEICEFVRIDSHSNAEGGYEGNLQRLIAGKMKEAGARVRMFEPHDIPDFLAHPLCYGPNRKYDDRLTVIGEIGPSKGPALLILAHSDTQPIHYPDRWRLDPFSGKRVDGNIYGRGCADDKWGLAAMLSLMRQFSPACHESGKRLIFASTIDEESGVGNGTLLLHLAGIKADAALYLDGYGMTHAYIGSCGGSSFFFFPKHDMDRERKESHAQRLKQACQELSAKREKLFDIPYYQGNIFRDRSIDFIQYNYDSRPYLRIDYYTVPQDDADRVHGEVRAVVAESLGEDTDRYDIKTRQPEFEPSCTAGKTPVIEYLLDSMSEVTGEEPVVETISKQDCFILNNHAHIPTVAFGPARIMGCDGAQHHPNEILNIDDAWQACRIAALTVNRWLTKDTAAEAGRPNQP